MRVLLSDGSGLTARQCANRLATAGHVVEVVAPDPLCLCRFTRHVERVHRVPAYGADPFGWLEAALAVYQAGCFDVLFPTQEQVAVLSLVQSRLDIANVATTVPPFDALVAVQDKLAASATLDRLGIPQPPSATQAEGWTRFPAFVKDPIGTASGGVRRVTTREELRMAAEAKPVLIQAAVTGPLVMCQSVFDHGSLVAFHANERTGEGVSGGASHKVSISVPEVRHWFEVLGADLGWHGALSADVILGDEGAVFIDVNPRLVEPQNAWLSGVDLMGTMLELATGAHPRSAPEGRPGVATHQLLLGVLGAAQHGRGRRGVATELVHAWRRDGPYRNSSEELSPLTRDPKAVVPLAAAAAATLIAPRTWSWLSAGSVANYALSDEAWRVILEAHRAEDPTPQQVAALRPQPPRLRQASRTAALMAVQRGLESSRPPHQRLFEDRLARSFLSGGWRLALAAARLRLLRNAIEVSYDLIGGPGPRASAIARTRLIDDLMEDLVPSVDQVVVLGAGYDTRPYRLGCLAEHRVFEVDHPGTQVAKRAVIHEAAAVERSNVIFVPSDFETDDLAEALVRAGFNAKEPALFLWEGVTQYLSAETVNATLAMIREISHPESFLVFTYVDSAVIDVGWASFPEAKRWLRGVQKRGEPWIFGIAPTEIFGFLSARGFRLLSDVSTAQAGGRYFAPLGRREQGSRLYHVATACRAEAERGH